MTGGERGPEGGLRKRATDNGIRALRWIGSKSIGVHKSGWEWMYLHPFTALGIALALVVCTRPQVHHIVADLPWPSWVAGNVLLTIWSVLITIAFVLVVAALIFASVVGAVLVIPEDGVVTDEDVAKTPRWRRWITRIHRWIAGSALHRLADLYPTIDARLTETGGVRRRRVLGAAFLFSALAWLLAPLAWDRRAPIEGLMLRQLLLALALAASGVWFLVTVKSPTSLRRRAIGRYVFMVALGLLGGEIIWSLPSWTRGGLSFRFFTIWGVLFMLFVIIATGRLVDRAKPAARLLVLVVAVVASQVDAGFAIDTRSPKSESAALLSAETAEWFTRLDERIKKGRPDRPVVLVAASGGGSRAAMFASLVFEHLAHVRFDGGPASGPEDSIANNIAVVSSVSGGSLATAYYLRQLQEPARERSDPHNFPATEVARDIVDISERWVEDAEDCKANSASCIRLDEDELVRQHRLEALPHVRDQVRALPAQGPALASWLFRSAFVDDMSTDFMAPLLRGVLTPFLERGHSVSVFWSEHFGWDGISEHGCWNSQPREAGSPMCDWGSKRPPPLALLNATNVQTGRRVVIGYPSVPQRLLGTEMSSLSDHGGSHDLTLADGVRLSANFPWGFEIGLFDQLDKTDAALSTGFLGRLKLTDGGVTDNSGLDTLATLIERLELLARPPKAEAEPVAGSREAFLAERSRLLLERLVKQGVALVEIDSGARPSTGGLFASVFPGVADPLDALSLAGYGGAATMKRGHVARIRQALERMAGQMATQAPAGGAPPDLLSQVRFECNHKDSVMTAWALGPKDKAKIMTLFLVEAEANRTALAVRRASVAQVESKTTSETKAAELEGTDAAKRMAKQLVQELRRGEEDRQQEEVESPIARQNVIRAVIATRSPEGDAVQTGRGGLGLRGVGPGGGGPGEGGGLGDLNKPLGFEHAPDGSAAAEALPPRRPKRDIPPIAPRNRSGWVYVGHYDRVSRRWQTTYLAPSGHDTLTDSPGALVAGAHLVASGRVNVRPDMPDPDGKFPPVQSVLRPNTTVTLSAAPVAWRETGFIWAQVNY